jgi:hypothetical protein
MQTRRRLPTVPSPDALERVSIDLVLGAVPTRSSRLTAGEHATLGAVRRSIATAAVGGPFDPRHILGLEGDAAARWEAERDAWVRARLAGDPRVAPE